MSSFKNHLDFKFLLQVYVCVYVFSVTWQLDWDTVCVYAELTAPVTDLEGSPPVQDLSALVFLLEKKDDSCRSNQIPLSIHCVDFMGFMNDLLWYKRVNAPGLNRTMAFKQANSVGST